MRTLSMLANVVCRNVQGQYADANGNPTAYKTQKVYEMIDGRYRQLYRRTLWPKTVYFTTAAVLASATTVVFPKLVGTVLRITNAATGAPLFSIDAVSMVDKMLSAYWFARSGSALAGELPTLTRIGTSNVLKQPASAAVVSIVSSSATDATTAGIYVFVRGGNAAGEVISESVLVNGVTPVTTTALFTTVDALSKTGTSTGIITVSSGANTLATIDSWEVSPEYETFKFEVAPTGNVTLNVLAQRRYVPFVNGADVAVFDMDEALIAGATADAYREQEKVELSMAWEQIAEQQAQLLMNREIGTTATVAPVKPSQQAAGIPQTAP